MDSKTRKGQENAPGRQILAPGDGWNMLMADVMAIPVEMLQRAPQADDVPVDVIFEKLGKPTGVGLPIGYMDTPQAGFHGLETQRGDVVVRNITGPRGVREIRVVRLGAAPDVDFYLAQIGQRYQPVIVDWDIVPGDEQRFVLGIVYKEKDI